MVKVTFQEWQEVVIHESIEYPLDQMINLQIVGVPAGGLANPLSWAEGVVFRHVTFPPTDDVIKDSLKGIAHWMSVEWSIMPSYEPIIQVKAQKVGIPINNVGANLILSEVARTLRQKSEVPSDERRDTKVVFK